MHSLIPNSPRNKHGEGGRSPPAGDVVAGSLGPPFVDGPGKVPIDGVHVSKAKLDDN